MKGLGASGLTFRVGGFQGRLLDTNSEVPKKLESSDFKSKAAGQPSSPSWY